MISGHEVGLACFICLIGIYSTSMAVAKIQDVQGSSSIMGSGNQSREGSRPPRYHAIVPPTTFPRPRNIMLFWKIKDQGR